ncbi:MAG: tRNA lysidine(34) synthetase TilS [Syntrophobacterales bacterium]|nr:MAG: tRNA lysidine(34) synthetase TilS [Syntrophobacterales bacterium]
MDFISKVKATVEKYRMLQEGDRVIVGVSGGIDSVVLLNVLMALRDEYDLSLIVAHLDHGIRGEEARGEADFVRNVAQGLALSFETAVTNVPALARREHISLQEAARKARYDFYEEMREKYGGQKVAMGQTADDQAETILMRVIRGTGLRGLKGIPPVRSGGYIRPLIEVSREEIERFADKEGLSFVTDSSNIKDIYLRNKVRHDLIPHLQGEYNPHIKVGLTRMASILSREDDYLDRKAEEVMAGLVKGDGEELSLDIPRLKAFHEAICFRVLQKMLAIMLGGDLRSIKTIHLDGIFRLLTHRAPNKMLNLPQGIRAEKHYTELFIRKGRPPAVSPFEYIIDVPGITILEGLGKKLITRIERVRKGTPKDIDSKVAYLDDDKLTHPLTLRSFKEGDRFIPLGMKGHKKLKDFFINTKTPKALRRRIPLLISRGTIVWVVGYRVNECFKLTEGSKRVLRAEYLDYP